jgi:iron-sulfur cluster repair protein YtfE (RIC family)
METMPDARAGEDQLSAFLEHDHREIDAPIEAFADGAGNDRGALAGAVRALRRHIYLEEELLFPPLRRAGLMGPVLVMLREHGQMWPTLDTLDQLLEAKAPDTALGNACRELLVQLQSHNPKEERILYPQLDVVLSASELGRVREFADSGELPEGWTCHHLRP